MTIKTNFSLLGLNTFGVAEETAFFTSVSSVAEVQQLIKEEVYQSHPSMMLGGGSNVLFTERYEGLVVQNQIRGRELLQEDEEHVWVKVGAGEVWHDFVLYCIEQNWAGVENMSLIPGSVGAAPIQNIGAYGVELKDVFESLEAVEVESGELKTFHHADCEFGYRDSIFKRWAKGKFIIVNVTFKLNKRPNFNTTYGAIQQTLEEQGVRELSLKAIAEAVIHIRQSKLPDPAEIGNGGSFFKNPVISTALFESLQQDYPQMGGYPAGVGKVKIAAGFLIDQAGWKGYREGNIGVHEKQALVLVNFGGNNGKAIYQLAKKIQASVLEKFGVEIEPEVNII
ncbi:UDP-N-acetylmuramate dehydrogenase [Persicobacter diffluens]|uniref:UDP-N-acetylenolpyruvoylglucosamine reductase n=1 Tax=Persicobacter diffluens TaxID=981 RepID=A0AAN4VY98_9BACT|nr:UDP-N-acetylenolpyruvoylglucosamine reductase [Persicobacter diffluens]